MLASYPVSYTHLESQIEFCKYELKGGNCKEYKDKGYSGKDVYKRQVRAKLPAGGNVYRNIMDKDTKGRPRNGGC